MYIGYAKNLSVTQRIFADVVNVRKRSCLVCYLTSSVKVLFLFNCLAVLLGSTCRFILFVYRMSGSPGVEACVYICGRNRPSRSYDA